MKRLWPLLLVACTAHPAPAPVPVPAAQPAPVVRKIILIGTNDLHGHLAALPVFGGYVQILRDVAAREHAALILADAGDMFQGTLESNLVEGESIEKAYEALGYSAVAVGNHEFDFGPLGPPAQVPRGQEGPAAEADPRGALRTRARGAKFPFLLANAARKDAHESEVLADLAPLRTRAVVEVSGVRIGFTGITSSDTSMTTLGANVRDLSFMPPGQAIEREAEALRREGANVVVALTHAGSKCAAFTGDVVADECETHGEVFGIAETLKPHAVDAIVAGHTHQGVAHTVHGVPVIESFSYGRAFGRIDLTLDEHGRVTGQKVYPPRYLCASKAPADAACDAGEYEGQKVGRDAAVERIAADYAERTRAKREALVGVSFTAKVASAYGNESALGNLFARLLREHAKVDLGLMNGGGLRDDLPAGPLHYGELFAAMPFDNRVATVTVKASDVKKLFAQNLQSTHGMLSIDGVDVVARCVGAELVVDLERGGKKLGDGVELTLAASDFLLGGGDDFGKLSAFTGKASVSDDVMRDVFEQGLRHAGTVDPARYLDAKRPHVRFPGPRPVHCVAER